LRIKEADSSSPVRRCIAAAAFSMSAALGCVGDFDRAWEGRGPARPRERESRPPGHPKPKAARKVALRLTFFGGG
jgi:hypothetical protein